MKRSPYVRSTCFRPGRFANNGQSFTLGLQKATVCHLSDCTMVALICSAGAVMSSIKNKTLANGNIMKGFFFLQTPQRAGCCFCDSFKLKSITKTALGNVIKQVPGEICSEAKVFKAHLSSKGWPSEERKLIHYLFFYRTDAGINNYVFLLLFFFDPGRFVMQDPHRINSGCCFDFPFCSQLLPMVSAAVWQGHMVLAGAIFDL